MKNKTVTVPIEWFEGLLEELQEKISELETSYLENRKLAPNSYGTGVEMGELTAYRDILGYIQSAEHIIKGGKDD